MSLHGARSVQRNHHASIQPRLATAPCLFRRSQPPPIGAFTPAHVQDGAMKLIALRNRQSRPREL
ncbi:hypothetical protein CBOM_07534 [Ceraceosorus bombacis]|uniref:Uncharacterized protein n=1 Tax=Ceraceosorus bombacis TaxID=401625 RepID=A0A0P1BFC7_9BASI|nr:hypothetical protein CBOM_07534 [Ceraceosorus bombacis]